MPSSRLQNASRFAFHNIFRTILMHAQMCQRTITALIKSRSVNDGNAIIEKVYNYTYIRKTLE